MFDALCDRKVAERRARQLLAGEISAAIYNVNRDPEKGEPLSALDFVPDLKRELEGENREQTPEEMIEILSSVMRCGPGR